MLDLFDLLNQLCHVLVGHILHNDQGDGTLAEILEKLVLPLYRVHILRQIVQHVIIDTGGHHTEHRRDQQHQGNDQNQPAVLDHRIRKTHTGQSSLSSSASISITSGC